MLTTRVEPIERDVAVIIGEEFSPQARSRHLADHARRAFVEADTINARIFGRVPASRTWVDNREGANLDSVRPDGQITREYDLVVEALEQIRVELRRTSPRLTGAYQESHALFADDVEVPIGAMPPIAQEYVLVSVAPYSRKLERLYSIYANAAAKRYAHGLKVRFTHRSVRGGAIGEWAARTGMTRQRRRMNRAQLQDWLTRQPAIVVTVR